MTQQQRVLGPALMAELKHISNAELSKAIQLVEQAFQLSASEPTRAYNLFEKSSIAFLQAIRSTCNLLLFLPSQERIPLLVAATHHHVRLLVVVAAAAAALLSLFGHSF